MMSILLPPLPKEQSLGWDTGYTADQLRARDLEVARVVLEAASRTTAGYWDDRQERLWAETCADAIRALEVSHAE